ncbi:MAG: hypothetical protein Hyperionvirus6_51 [Hyperionvirus sp.]|uniref:Uncharacterized protein n=1 Tax=Hyperionvirus sp. TaxID=2487770 RepID=A0A3G5A7W2_9VIRU|nr:MAG: hypothetical protein Hyperionvirus6_51 [Hyperionvirus sp.]
MSIATMIKYPNVLNFIIYLIFQFFYQLKKLNKRLNNTFICENSSILYETRTNTGINSN